MWFGFRLNVAAVSFFFLNHRNKTSPGKSLYVKDGRHHSDVCIM